MRRSVFFAVFFLFLFQLPATAKDPREPMRMPSEALWSLRLPSESAVVFRGRVDYDKAGIGSAAILYPAPDPITFLVALAAHGAVNASMKKSQKTKLEEQADQVLMPYRPVLEKLSQHDLIVQALAMMPVQGHRLMSVTESAGDGWQLETAPVFSMTQDQRAIVLDNVVALYAPGDASAPSYANSVHVVSTPRSEVDLTTLWNDNDGAALKAESAALLAESIKVFLADVTAVAIDPAQKSRTIRYVEGSTEKIERATVVAERCERLTLKNLRGWLLSVPASDRASCGSPSPAAGEGPSLPSTAPTAG